MHKYKISRKLSVVVTTTRESLYGMIWYDMILNWFSSNNLRYEI